MHFNNNLPLLFCKGTHIHRYLSFCTIIQTKSHHITCPLCRASHRLPAMGAKSLLTNFKIDSLLKLHKNISARKMTAQTSCPKHNDKQLEFYCETCCLAICQDCTIQHNQHRIEFVSDCYIKFSQRLQAEIKLLKLKTANVDAAAIALATREREVTQQGEEAKKEIHMHALELIDQVQRSERELLQQVNNTVQQKRDLLKIMREEAERVYIKLKTCEVMVEQSLKERDQQLQVMLNKERMVEQIKAAMQQEEQLTDSHLLDKADIKFIKRINIRDEIGEIMGKTYAKVFVKLCRCSSNTASTATLTLQSHDGSPFSLPPSLISCKLSSPGYSRPIKCQISQTQQGKYSIKFTPCTSGEHQLLIQVGGVDIPGSPFTLPEMSSAAL